MQAAVRQLQLLTFVLRFSPESEVSLKAVEKLQNFLCSLSLSPKSRSPPGYFVTHLLIYFACQNGIFSLDLPWETHLDQAGRKLHCRQVMKDLAQDIFLLFQSFNQNCATIVNNEILLSAEVTSSIHWRAGLSIGYNERTCPRSMKPPRFYFPGLFQDHRRW